MIEHTHTHTYTHTSTQTERERKREREREREAHTHTHNHVRMYTHTHSLSLSLMCVFLFLVLCLPTCLSAYLPVSLSACQSVCLLVFHSLSELSACATHTCAYICTDSTHTHAHMLPACLSLSVLPQYTVSHSLSFW